MKLITGLLVSCLTWMRRHIKSVFSSGRWWLLERLYVLYTICLYLNQRLFIPHRSSLSKYRASINLKNSKDNAKTVQMRCLCRIEDANNCTIHKHTHFMITIKSICIKIPFQGNNLSMKAKGIFRNVLYKWEVYLRLYRPP